MTAPDFDEKTRTELEAAAFRRLVQHLRERTDVQNIDMMNLAGFCRNCLSRWYREAADARGIGLADPDAREIVYGMPYKEWQAKYDERTSEIRMRCGYHELGNFLDRLESANRFLEVSDISIDGNDPGGRKVVLVIHYLVRKEI